MRTVTKKKEKKSYIPYYIESLKAHMSVRYPFYGEILAHIEFIRNDSVSTVCTTGREIIYNEDFLHKKSVSERNYIIMHEVMHIILKHWKRPGERYPQIWNLAADYVVNYILDNQIVNLSDDVISFTSPKERLHLDTYNGESVEELYADIISDHEKYKKHIRFVERDLFVIAGMSDEEAEVWESELDSLIQTGIRKCCSRGRFDGIPQYCFSMVVSKQISWKRILRRFLSVKETEDITYTTPERKYIHMDMILPGYGKDEERRIGTVWAFIDDSGSVGKDELNEFITQLHRIISECKATLNIVFWNDGIDAEYMNVKKDQLFQCVPRSSGGTDPECIYRYLDEKKIDPTVMIILTDGIFTTVRDQLVNKRNRKTILVISPGGCCAHNSMGKITKL